MSKLAAVEYSETECSSTLSTASSFETENQAERSVSFGEVEIREHEVILGDNPAVSGGPPVTIDWSAVSSRKLSVDEHQRAIADEASDDRPRSGGTLPAQFRVSYLLSSYSSMHIQNAQSEARRIQQSRQLSRRDRFQSMRLFITKCRRKTSKCKAWSKPGSAEAWLKEYKQASKENRQCA